MNKAFLRQPSQQVIENLLYCSVEAMLSILT